MSSPLEPIAKAGDLLLDGKVRVDRVYKPENVAAHAYVLAFPHLSAGAESTTEVRIGFQQPPEMRKRDLMQAAKTALANAENRAR